MSRGKKRERKKEKGRKTENRKSLVEKLLFGTGGSRFCRDLPRPHCGVEGFSDYGWVRDRAKSRTTWRTSISLGSSGLWEGSRGEEWGPRVHLVVSALPPSSNRAHPHTETSTKAGGSSEGSWAKGKHGKMLGASSVHRGTEEEGELHLKLGRADPALGEATGKPTLLVLHHWDLRPKPHRPQQPAGAVPSPLRSWGGTAQPRG